MKKAKKSFLAEPPFQLVMALLATLLLAWPIIQIAGERGTISLFFYVFGIWGALIVLLWRIGRAISAAPPDSQSNGGRP